MRDPIRLKLEYLASTYGIENLGLAWIEDNVADGNRTLVLCEVPESVGLLTQISRPDLSADAAPLTEDDLNRWMRELD